MFQALTFDTEKEAIDYKKKMRWRKCVISYSEYWKCWTLTRNLKL